MKVRRMSEIIDADWWCVDCTVDGSEYENSKGSVAQAREHAGKNQHDTVVRRLERIDYCGHPVEES